MKIVSWNINSLRRREDQLLGWLAKTKPDIVCLQETKCTDEQFPELALRGAGYHSAFHGQKSYNGVAILSRSALQDVRASLCDEEEDPQARVIAATIGAVRIHYPEPGLFSWWDYRMLAFPKNRGLRIDAILASKSLAEHCSAGGIEREMRKGKEPSDHAPVWAEFEM